MMPVAGASVRTKTPKLPAHLLTHLTFLPI